MTATAEQNGYAHSVEELQRRFDRRVEERMELDAEIDELKRQARARGVNLGSSLGQLDTLLAHAGISPARTIRELLDSDVEHDFMIEGILATGMTTVIAGASKGMKTSIAVDLALSLSLGDHFLGRFRVPIPKRVLMFSVESGEASIKETAERVIKAKELPEGSAQDQLRIHGDWIPRSGEETHTAILKAMIEAYGTEVVILDPTYFMVDGDNQANQSKQGQELRDIAKSILDAGATPVFVDHVKLSSMNVKEHAPLELGDLSGAAKSAFFRQWLLLSRRERFDPNTPIHRLWMSYGGNHGRHGEWGVDIDETRDAKDRRIWDVTIQPRQEVTDEMVARAERDKAAEKERRDTERVRQAVVKIRSVLPAGEVWSKTQLRTASGLNKANSDAGIAHLISRGELISRRHKNGSGPWFEGLEWTSEATHVRGRQ